MARYEVAHGTVAAVRQLAQNMVVTQTREIAQMTQLLRQLGTSDFWIGVIYATHAITQFLLMNKYDRGIHANYFRSIEIEYPSLCSEI